MGEKRRRHFPNHAPKKVVKRVKVVFRPEKTRRQPHRLRHLHRLFSGRFENCQFLAALPSVHGAKNVTRLIMVQGILSQPMILLSTGVGELTLLTKTQMAVGIETSSDAERIGRHFARIVIHAAYLEFVLRTG